MIPKGLNCENGTASLVVTKNIWFIGTANNDDSTSLITDKVYDRAQILDMDEREPAFTVDNNLKTFSIGLQDLHKLFVYAKNDSNLRLSKDDWRKIEDIDVLLKEMGVTFGNRMQTQLDTFVPVYRACGGSKEQAIDYFLAHKILRKLENSYDKYLTSCFKELRDYLNDAFGDNSFKFSLNKMEIIKKRNGLGDEE